MNPNYEEQQNIRKVCLREISATTEASKLKGYQFSN